MRFRIFNTIWRVKKAWRQIIPDGEINTYQTYEFNKLCFQYRITSISNIKRKNIKCKFVVAFENNKPVCIAPLVIDDFPEKYIRLLGHGTNAGYLDFIYRDERYVVDVLEYCKRRFQEYKFDFIFVKESSPLFNSMNSVEEFNNYTIYIRDYDTYLSSLSKSTRQNIRTAYNRLNKDELTYDFTIHDNNKIANAELKDINELYHKRKSEWTGEKELSTRRKKIFLSRDVIFRGIKKMDSSCVAVLKIDNKNAAFFVGFKFEGGIYIPRLAINSDFSRYSPGIILINEFLRIRLIDQKGYIFDLCRGDEKYKSTLGGSVSTTHRLQVL